MPVRRLHVIGLIRAEVDERRDEQEVGALGLEEQLEVSVRRQHGFGERQQALRELPVTPQQRPALEHRGQARRRVLGGAGGELGRPRVARVEKSQVVARAPQRRRDLQPAIDAARRARDHFDARVVVQRPGRPERLPLARRSHGHGVAARRKAADHPFEVPRLAQIVNEKQDPQLEVRSVCGQMLTRDSRVFSRGRLQPAAGQAALRSVRTRDPGAASAVAVAAGSHCPLPAARCRLPMKLLFFARHWSYLRNFESAIEALAARGHTLHLVADVEESLGGRQMIERLVARYPGRLSMAQSPVRGVGAWSELARRLRLSLDYLRYLDPQYADTPHLGDRARERAPRDRRQADAVAALQLGRRDVAGCRRSCVRSSAGCRGAAAVTALIRRAGARRGADHAARRSRIPAARLPGGGQGARLPDRCCRSAAGTISPASRCCDRVPTWCSSGTRRRRRKPSTCTASRPSVSSSPARSASTTGGDGRRRARARRSRRASGCVRTGRSCCTSARRCSAAPPASRSSSCGGCRRCGPAPTRG